MDKELLKMVSNHQNFETKNASSLKSIVDGTDSSIIKMFLGGIMLDSTKHASILQAIMDIDAGQVLWDIDKQKMVEQLNIHLEIENTMLKSIQDIIIKNKDGKIAPLINGILSDERKHHELLIQLLKTIENMEYLKEEWVNMYVQFQQEDFGRT